MYKSATQRKYNQGTKARNPIINILLNDCRIIKQNIQSKFPFRGTGGGFIPAAPLLHLRSQSIQL